MILNTLQMAIITSYLMRKWGVLQENRHYFKNQHLKMSKKQALGFYYLTSNEMAYYSGCTF